LSAAGLLGSPCHPGRGLVWAKPGIPWFTQKKKILNLILFYIAKFQETAEPARILGKPEVKTYHVSEGKREV